MLLTAEKISKKFLEKPILDNVLFSINEGDKIGVIGLNGAGKSTFLKIIAGMESPDSGCVVKTTGLRIGYLPQNPDFSGNSTVLEEAMAHISAQQMQQRDAKEYECKAILNKLGLPDFDKKVGELSGGQKRRLSIACALVAPVDLLILDEPTNHIDNETIEWLESYLQKYNGALLMVTHDRYFLDRVTNKIAELQNGQIYVYPSNYSKYLELKAQREEMMAASERKRQALLQKELAWIQQGPKARGTKQKFRLERYEEMSSQQTVLGNDSLQMSSMSSRLGKKIIELKDVSKGYDGQTLFRDFTYTLLRRDRIGIVGKNGCGKSTLLKIIAGSVLPDSGTVERGQTVRIGIFSQEGEQMPADQRVIDYIKDISAEVTLPEGKFSASQMLERFLFPSDLQYSAIGRLSGGERRRLELLGVLMQAPNILLFDEPTNDLDTQTLMILEDYLEEFSGAVAVVSHDRYFLDKVADYIFAIEEDGQIHSYVGGYTDYTEQRPAEPQKAKAEKPVRDVRKENRGTGKLKFTFNEQREYDQIDSVIAKLEETLAETETALHREASNYARLEELISQKKELEAELSRQMERWVYLNDLADRIASQS